MATFTCSDCGFSKQVADEMAGKKARCPKCNSVNDIPPLDAEDDAAVVDTPVAEDETQETDDSASDTAEPPAATATDSAEQDSSSASQQAAPDTNNGGSTNGARTRRSHSAALPKLSVGWLAGFGGAAVLLAIAAVLLIFNQVGFSMICFAAGTILFCVLAVLFAFADSFGKRN